VRLDAGKAMRVKPGLPLGLEAQTGAQEAVEPLHPGDGFVVFTDALYEARAPEGAAPEHFGLERIDGVVAGLAGADPADVVRTLRGAVEAFAAGDLSDDLCIVAFRALPAREPLASRRIALPGTASTRDLTGATPPGRREGVRRHHRGGTP
jgi:hypothetical protein